MAKAIKDNAPADFEREVEHSDSLSDEARKLRLDDASKLPEQVQVISKAYKRNPDVVYTVLQRANGVCESCKQKAPFVRTKVNPIESILIPVLKVTFVDGSLKVATT